MGRYRGRKHESIRSTPMSAFWTGRQVLVTGGSGFLGSAVLAQLAARGADRVVCAESADHDLRDPTAVADLFAASEPELVIHLAARVGGIGANRARPADLYLDNLLMGTYVIEEARRRDTPKVVVVGTICSYPKFTPVPFQESSLWQGYPEETNAPYGIAKLAQLVQLQSNRAQYGQNGIYLMPTNLYGPGDKFHAAVSPRDPGADQEVRRGARGRRRPHRGVGHGLGRAGSSSTSTTRPRASPWRPSATTAPSP